MPLAALPLTLEKRSSALLQLNMTSTCPHAHMNPNSIYEAQSPTNHK